MAAAVAQYYFRFRICWYRCLQKVKVYEWTKFRRLISIDGWDITTSVFEKQTSTVLEIYFRFRTFARNLHIILHQATEFFPNRHIHFSRWRPEYYFRFRICWCHSFAAFTPSISKSNFVELSQMEAEVFFMAIQNGLGRGQIFFQNQECVNILGCSVTFYEYKNVFWCL